MSNNRSRTRSQLVSTVAQTLPWWKVLLQLLQRADILKRLGLCLVAAVALLVMTQGWFPPRDFYPGEIPTRDILASVEFEQVDVAKTEEARKKARSLAIAVFKLDPAPLDQLWAKLQNDVQLILGAESLAAVDSSVWESFQQAPANPADKKAAPVASPEEQFAKFKTLLTAKGAGEKFQAALDASLAKIRKNGLLESLPPDHNANFQLISIQPEGAPVRNIAVDDVLIERAAEQLYAQLKETMPSPELATIIFRWLKPKLPVTLTLDKEATQKAKEVAGNSVEPILRKYTLEPTPENILAKKGVPIEKASLVLLELEYQAKKTAFPWWAALGRSAALLGMYFALFTLCGFYIHYQSPSILQEYSKLIPLLLLVLVTVGMAILLETTLQGWQVELVPLLLFGMVAAIAYRQELALLLSAAMVLVIAVGLGQSLYDALLLLAVTACAILMLDRIRNRSKLLSVGFIAAIVAFLTAVGVGTLNGLPLFPTLVISGGRLALWAVIAGSLMTCILPFIERIFGVLTDISLIDLGDPAHPLLQELIRRAPGTYNHSITVASLAEAATDAIGGRTLLVRVGAYFHDIGKMLKPAYFIENQTQGDNRHESLVPAMSTLVIIAHVKDGIDLARKHRLPEPIVEFIQQHHGTTLVEYFYHQANKKNSEEGGDTVDESTFRYPGPKPQSKEVAVLMLADAVESASRVLVEPAPSRIESLVKEITMKRLLDGQFDECGLTLAEVHTIGKSLVKSLASVYHGRVKYPETESA